MILLGAYKELFSDDRFIVSQAMINILILYDDV